MTTTTAPIQLRLALYAPTCWHCPAPAERQENRRGLRVPRCGECDEMQKRLGEAEIEQAIERKWK